MGPFCRSRCVVASHSIFKLVTQDPRLMRSDTGIPHSTIEEVVFKDYVIPKGTILLPNIPSMMRNPERYTNPNEFNPARFLNDESDSIASSHSQDWSQRDHVHFGWGRRLCPGAYVADICIFMAVSRILWGFRIQQDPTVPVDMEDLSGSFPTGEGTKNGSDAACTNKRHRGAFEKAVAFPPAGNLPWSEVRQDGHTELRHRKATNLHIRPPSPPTNHEGPSLITVFYLCGFGHTVFFINCLLVCLLSAQPSDCSSLSLYTKSITALYICSCFSSGGTLNPACFLLPFNIFLIFLERSRYLTIK
jgi:hypothetical protein